MNFDKVCEITNKMKGNIGPTKKYLIVIYFKINLHFAICSKIYIFLVFNGFNYF